jgi:hypothetical protein
MPRTPCRASSRSRTSCSGARSARAALLAGLEHLDDRYLKAVGYATKEQARRPAQDGAGRRHRRRRRRRGPRHQRGGAHRQRPRRRRALSPSAPKRARSSGSTASAPPPSPPHQRLQDQRGRGDPAAAHGRVHRRHRAHQHRAEPAQQAELCDALAGLFRRGTCRWASTDDAGETSQRRAAGRPRAAGAGAAAGEVRALWQGWLDNLDGCQGPTAARATLFPQLQDHTLRASWKTQIRKPLQRMFPARLQADLDACAAHPPARCCGPRLGGAAHARRRRQCAHQHPGQQRQLRDAADRARAVAHHGAGAQPGRRDLGRARHRHHQAGVPDRRRAAAVHRLQGAGRPQGRFNKGKLLREPALRAASPARRCILPT